MNKINEISIMEYSIWFSGLKSQIGDIIENNKEYLKHYVTDQDTYQNTDLIVYITNDKFSDYILYNHYEKKKWEGIYCKLCILVTDSDCKLDDVKDCINEMRNENNTKFWYHGYSKKNYKELVSADIDILCIKDFTNYLQEFNKNYEHAIIDYYKKILKLWSNNDTELKNIYDSYIQKKDLNKSSYFKSMIQELSLYYLKCNRDTRDAALNWLYETFINDSLFDTIFDIVMTSSEPFSSEKINLFCQAITNKKKVANNIKYYKILFSEKRSFESKYEGVLIGDFLINNDFVSKDLKYFVKVACTKLEVLHCLISESKVDFKTLEQLDLHIKIKLLKIINDRLLIGKTNKLGQAIIDLISKVQQCHHNNEYNNEHYKVMSMLHSEPHYENDRLHDLLFNLDSYFGMIDFMKEYNSFLA